MYSPLLHALFFSVAATARKCDGSCEAAEARGLLQKKASLDQLVNVIEHMREDVAKMREHEQERTNEEKRMKEEVDSIRSSMKDFAGTYLAPAGPSSSLANKTALFQGCAAKSQKLRIEAHAENRDQAAVASVHSACPAGELKLRDYSASSFAEGCCPESSTTCAGCAVSSAGSCQKCAGGFLLRAGKCISCADTVGWASSAGLTCAQLPTGGCDDVKVKGLSSNEACCQCGGGHVTATPFAYEVRHWALGDTVSMTPTPRTAERYSLDEGCELANYNLTMDGATGVVSSVPGRDPAQEAFSVECTVTAHQAAGVTFDAKVRVAMDWLAYSVPVLLFESPSSFPAMKAPGTWKDFSTTCAPQTAWLQVDASGTLTRGTSNSAGAVATEDTALAGQSGGVCVVSAWHLPPASTKWQQRTAKVVAIWPQPWASLRYEASAVSVTLGEQLPVLSLVPPAGEGLLKPSNFFVACDASPALNWSFDSLLGTGLLEGHSLLEVSEDGGISISPGAEMSAIFDALPSFGSTRKKVFLSCGVWGVFPDESLAPVKANLIIGVLDNVCWVAKAFKSFYIVDAASSEADCRANCRADAKCPSFLWVAGECRRHMAHATGTTVNAWAKVTDCTAEAACLEVSSGSWYSSGLFCPVTADLFRSDVLYLKEGATPQETLYLGKYVAAIDGPLDGCSDGSWILRQADSSKDYIKPDSGEVELGGTVVQCLSGGVSFGVATCGKPNITEPEEGLAPMVVDDPHTTAPADYWLHPCECAPAAWGMEKPVNPESFESVPGKSGNKFIPPAFMLVSGQFVCPARFLLTNGVHFETETESMERSDCEARCKAQQSCVVFWQGNQQGANTCRLYSACPHLVRELGLEGKLEAVPRSQACQVADPELCWATSLRRASLTAGRAQPFWYWELHQQCDEQLLLGGGGVDACARPTYRDITSHAWEHKMQLPDSFLHGTQLKVSCWTERYSGLMGSGAASEATLFCVNGRWFNGQNQPELGSFSCEACVQVGGSGYKDLERRNEQELWFFNRMKLRLSTEVLDKSYTQAHCLRFGSGTEDLMMVMQDTCEASLIVNFTGITDSDSREVKFLELVDGRAQCLAESMSGDLPIAIHQNCSPADAAQQIPIDDLPGLLWRIHTKHHEEAGHRLRNAMVDCWGRGAVGKVDMQHLFNTNPAQTEGFVGRATFPANLHVTSHAGTWTYVSGLKYGWAKNDYYPEATRVRACITFSDSATSGSLQLRMIHASGAVQFTDSFVNTYSGTQLFHHKCGVWHDLSSVYCGWGWDNSCALQWKYHAGADVYIKSFELEMGSNDPAHSRAFRGRFDLPVHFDQVVAANSWYQIGYYESWKRVNTGLATWSYPDAKYIRSCIVFTDKSAGGNLVVAMKSDNGVVQFQDTFTGTWSNNGLVHSDCGAWHPISDVSGCGFGFGATCQPEIKHTEGVHVKVWQLDLEMKSDDPNVNTAFLGRVSLDATTHIATNPAVTSTWFRISDPGIFIDANDYPTATEFRACVAFTDNGQGGGGMKTRIRRTDYAGGIVFAEDFFGDTWSGSGLARLVCGAWRPLSTLSCGASWTNTCQVDAMHEQNVGFAIFSMSLEFRSSLPRDVCRFAPVISREVDDMVELFKIGSWQDWQYHLADAPVYCPEGKVLTDLNATTEHLMYSCGAVAGLGSCVEGFSPQADVKDWTNFRDLGSLSVVCPQESLLNGFHFEFSEGGNWMRFRFTCCNAAGAPTVLASTYPGPGPALEGLYCPSGKDASGRASYLQQFDSLETITASDLGSSSANDCQCYGCATGYASMDVGLKGTFVAGDVKVQGWGPACRVYCDSTLVLDKKSNGLFPLDGLCKGATKIEIWGGGHCGSCFIDGNQLTVLPYAKQPSLLSLGSVRAPQSLHFDPVQGQWCIGSSCTAPGTGPVAPVGLSSDSFDVVAVSDFDGEFKGKGVPKQGGGGQEALKARLRGIKTPKRPKAPKAPKLEGFTAEDPTYAAECMDYSQLWTSIQESYKDATGVVIPHMNNLAAEPVYDLPETNPCAVAAAVSGTRGKIGGGDGSSTGEKMDYTELDGCAARVITRGLEAAKLDRDAAVFETITDVASESVDLLCDVPPNVETAPMGLGAEFQPEDICGDFKDMAEATLLLTNFHGGIGFANSIYAVEEEDNADCDPIQAGLDRLFCDVHCVRDAVVRGDRAILRNLKAATDVTNNNLKKMVEWSVAANRAETGWLASKMDTMEDRLSIRIQLVQDALASANTAALVEAKRLSQSMLKELSGFAEGAGSMRLPKKTAAEALGRFAREAQKLSGPLNSTSFLTASTALRQLQTLHATLLRQSTTGRVKSLGAQFQHEALNLQELARRQLKTLGVYRQHGNVTSRAVRAWQAEGGRGALMEMDRLWWELRGKLDAYLDAAEQQVSAFQASASAIASYEHCAAQLGQVQQSYAHSLAATHRGHAALRRAWRESLVLFGELGAVITDGDLFGALIRAEGCGSKSARQTLRQTRYAVKALGLLAHRFQVGGLPKPDGSVLVQSVRRIQGSFKKAHAACGK